MLEFAFQQETENGRMSCAGSIKSANMLGQGTNLHISLCTVKWSVTSHNKKLVFFTTKLHLK